MKKKILIFLFLLGTVELPAQTIVQELFSVGGPSHISDMDVKAPTSEGSILIAMPGPLAPGIKVLGINDNAPGGGNIYKQVPEAASSCGGKVSLDVWYCENCKGGVTELKYHFSGHVPSINAFLEVSQLASPAVIDGSGAHLSDGTVTSTGSEVGPTIKTTANDFIIARYFSSDPAPSGVSPAAWNFKTTYVYTSGAAGTYQPTLTGGKAEAGNFFCMSVAAFKTGASNAISQNESGSRHSRTKSTLFSDDETAGD